MKQRNFKTIVKCSLLVSEGVLALEEGWKNQQYVEDKGPRFELDLNHMLVLALLALHKFFNLNLFLYV